MSIVNPIVEDTRERIVTPAPGVTSLGVPFYFQKSGDIAVSRRANSDAAWIDLVEGVDYLIAGAGIPSGGTVTLSAPANGTDQYGVLGSANLSRLTSVVQGGATKGAALDYELDRTRIIELEARRDINANTANLIAEAAARYAADVFEANARTAADEAEAAARVAADFFEANARNAGDAAEALARASADQAEISARIAGDLAEANIRLSADYTLDHRIDQVRDAVFAAAPANTFPTKTAAVTAILTIPLNGYVQVVTDETQGGFRTLYQKTGVSTYTLVTLLDYPGTVETRTILAAIGVPKEGRTVTLSEPGRAGQFVWRLGDYSTFVANDPFQIVYVPSSVVANTVGCWVREYSGELNARWAGCVSDTTAANYATATDNAPALQALFNLAYYLKASVYIPSSSPGRGPAGFPVGVSGGYGIKTGLTTGQGIAIRGDGEQGANSYGITTVGTTLVAIAAMSAMLKLSGTSHCERIGFNGGDAVGSSYLAKVCVWWDLNARPTADNLHCVRASFSSFLLDRTQNGLFKNLTSRFSHSCIALVNQARNNTFVHCTGEVGNAAYTGPNPTTASQILLLCDFTDSLYTLGLTIAVPAPGGIDRNHFIGGIFERAPVGIRVVTDGLYLDKQSNQGINDWYCVEFTCDKIIATDDALTYEGTFHIDSPRWGTTNETTYPYTSGSNGYIHFTGPCSFSGAGSIVNRGISLSSNYMDLFRTVQSDIRRTPNGVGFGDGSNLFPIVYDTVNDALAFDPVTSGITMTIPASRLTATNGVTIAFSGPAQSGNTSQPGVTMNARQPLIEITFTLSGIPVGQLCNVYIEQSSGRRLLGTYGNGSQSVLTQIAGTDSPRVRFGRGTINDGAGVASWTIANFSMRVKA